MFKFIRKKLLEGIIKDIAKEIPAIKDKALKLFEEKKDEVLKIVEEKIKEIVKEQLGNILNKLG